MQKHYCVTAPTLTENFLSNRQEHPLSQTHTHHESRDVCLCGVWGQVDLPGRTALVLGIHHHAVACEAL